MSFEVPADAYDRFMGVHSRQLAPQLADLAELTPDARALDVGCGPGSLTTELVERLGEESVAAVDPSESFVAAARTRHPGVDVQRLRRKRCRIRTPSSTRRSRSSSFTS